MAAFFSREPLGVPASIIKHKSALMHERTKVNFQHTASALACMIASDAQIDFSRENMPEARPNEGPAHTQYPHSEKP